jgi:hypothetical protein
MAAVEHTTARHLQQVDQLPAAASPAASTTSSPGGAGVSHLLR